MPINPPPFDFISAYGIGGLAVLMAVICVAVYGRGQRRRTIGLAIGIALVMAISVLAATSGLLTRFDLTPPPMMLMIVVVLVLSMAVGLSPLGGRLAAEISLPLLVGLQAFRFPLELVMHRAAELSIMPEQLSYSGYNFDIFTGLGSIILFGLMVAGISVPLGIIWVWNLYGLLCLAVIMVIAVTTSPLVAAFGPELENLNTWVLYFPYVWLPVVLVTIAISGHLIITRKLMKLTTL